jgi:AmpD protein
MTLPPARQASLDPAAPARELSAGKGASPSAWVDGGWHARARIVASPNFGARPPGRAVDLVVVHSISLPPGVYGGDAIERLFTNRLAADVHASFAEVAGLRVSAHFLIRRDGELLQFVDVDQRAWHAGVSCWRGRSGCNDFSVGIELEGLPGDAFEPAQYRCLAGLLADLAQRWPIAEVTGHEHVAPGRKDDPGHTFDWPKLAGLLATTRLALTPSVQHDA